MITAIESQSKMIGYHACNTDDHMCGHMVVSVLYGLIYD